MSKKTLISKCSNGDTLIGLSPEEHKQLEDLFWSKGTKSKEYQDFINQMKTKYGNRVEASIKLPEVTVTAEKPRQTQWSQMSTDDKINTGLTLAGFIPGLDVVADVVDIGREAWKGNWGNVALGIGVAAIPGLSLAGYKAGKYFKNNISFKIPKAQYYRVLSDLDDSKVSDAIDDLTRSGVVRTNPKGTYKEDGTRERYIGPYFYEGTPFRAALNKSSKILTSNSKNLDWLPIKPHETVLRKTNGYNQFTPLYQGVPNTAPTSEFELWERGNNFITKNFWFKKNLPNRAIQVKPFTYPERYNMAVHTDYGDHHGSFGSGAYINELNTLIPGQNFTGQNNYIWFNENKPYAMSINGKPVTRIIVGNKNSIDGLVKVRDMNIPVGQWNGSKGFVLNSELVTSKPQNMDNLLLFEWSPELNRFQLKKQGGRLIPKHSKGNKVTETFGLDPSQFKRNPNNNKQDNKDTNKLTKQKRWLRYNSFRSRPAPLGMTYVHKQDDSNFKNT